MNWIPLTEADQLTKIKSDSHDHPVVIFKHSTRCSISHMAKTRMDRGTVIEGVDYYYLDLLAYRPISNLVAETFAVHHESPQLLLIRNGECMYEETHNGIDPEELREQV
ncbi:MAG: bacillithiol system redox-active protein YtxJ [Chitinophagaceae bacterium]